MYSTVEKNRLHWRSRRGMLELDLVLVPFFEQMFDSLSADQQDTFVRLLEQEDPDLMLWFSRNGQSSDSELQALVEFILDAIQ
ncbi:MAG: succinate dehydrogenase assembly factor 2 [Pseudomonadales bacterium]|nr:succinate dehydrogenase assembly factor 2 [Pseudomonadales bacterium]